MAFSRDDFSSLVQACRYSEALKLVIKHFTNVGRKNPLREQAAELMFGVMLNVKSRRSKTWLTH